MPVITELEVVDVRFPTSLYLDGSDAMNPDPDYSAAYLVLHTDEGPDGTASSSRSAAATTSRPPRSGRSRRT